MNYISTREIAEKWGISTARITKLASEGRIVGAVKAGRNWLIPDDAQKPSDERFSNSKDERFVFPFIFHNYCTEEELVQRYTEDECLLYKAQYAYECCRLTESEEMLKRLISKPVNIYVRIGALYHLCLLSMDEHKHNDLVGYLDELKGIFSKDFPHKRDVEFVQFDLNNLFYFNTKLGLNYKIDYSYSYNSSTEVYLIYLSSFVELFRTFIYGTDIDPSIYLLSCSLFVKNGYFYYAQLLHACIGAMYYLKGDYETVRHHFRKAIDISVEKGYISSLARFSTYFRFSFYDVLKEYSPEIQKQFAHISAMFQNTYLSTLNRHNPGFSLENLNPDDFRFIRYAILKYSNKQISSIEHLSENSISKRYIKIYEKLGVSSKKELVELNLNLFA